MLSKDQSQEVADGSTAIQAAGNVTIITSGLTYSDVRGVALDVFEANFYKLSEVAMGTAKTRAEEVIEKFISKLQKEHPKGLERANDPDFQYALYTVEREYARTGDKDLGDLLVDLLVDRSKQEQRNILQIVLNESLETAPKLTEQQLAALAVIFMFKYTERRGMGNHQVLGTFLDDAIQPFVGKLVKTDTCYQHLDFCGCGSVQLGHDRAKILSLYNTGTMNESEVRQKCVDIRPFMATLFDVWSASPIKQFVLTSVGIAIGHANVKRLIGPFADLSIWIN